PWMVTSGPVSMASSWAPGRATPWLARKAATGPAERLLAGSTISRFSNNGRPARGHEAPSWVSCLSVKELHTELNQSRRLGFQDVVKVGRADVTVRQMEICVIQNIEKLCPELQRFRFRQANVLQSREIPVAI